MSVMIRNILRLIALLIAVPTAALADSSCTLTAFDHAVSADLPTGAPYAAAWRRYITSDVRAEMFAMFEPACRRLADGDCQLGAGPVADACAQRETARTFEAIGVGWGFVLGAGDALAEGR